MATHSSVLAWRINPRDRGAWWAAVYGVAQSQTLLKRQQQQQHHKNRKILTTYGNKSYVNLFSLSKYCTDLIPFLS